MTDVIADGCAKQRAVDHLGMVDARYERRALLAHRTEIGMHKHFAILKFIVAHAVVKHGLPWHGGNARVDPCVQYRNHLPGAAQTVATGAGATGGRIRRTIGPNVGHAGIEVELVWNIYADVSNVGIGAHSRHIIPGHDQVHRIDQVGIAVRKLDGAAGQLQRSVGQRVGDACRGQLLQETVLR